MYSKGSLRWSKSQFVDELRMKEQADSGRNVHDSFDNFLKQTMGTDSFSSLNRSSDKPMQCIYWPDTFDHHLSSKLTRGLKLDLGLEMRGNGSVQKSGFNGYKSGLGLGRGLHGTGEGFQSLRVPQAVIAFAQAAARVNDFPGWPLLSPTKVQMQKCEKCLQEFCSLVNYRRHVRGHRKSLHADKEDLRKERSNITKFWNKLSLVEASQILSVKTTTIEDLSGNATIKGLTSFIQQPAFPFLPQTYFRSGVSLLEVVQTKVGVFPVSAEDLFKILDDATEKTFLSGGTSVSVERYIFQGEATKVSLEDKNLVASLAFLVEHKLVDAWIADKDAEALRCQRALVEEEDAAQKKREKVLERKRLKKLKQKEKKGPDSTFNDDIGDEDISLARQELDPESPIATGSSLSSGHVSSLLQAVSLPEGLGQEKVDGHAPKVHDNDKPYYQQKNGRVNWERRWTDGSEVQASQKFRNSTQEDLSAHKSSRKSFTNGIKSEQDNGSFPRYSQYRNKFQRASRASNAGANGYVVWARKTKGTSVCDASTDIDSKASDGVAIKSVEHLSSTISEELMPVFHESMPVSGGSSLSTVTPPGPVEVSDILPTPNTDLEEAQISIDVKGDACPDNSTMTEYIELENAVEGALLIGSLSVPLSSYMLGTSKSTYSLQIPLHSSGPCLIEKELLLSVHLKDHSLSTSDVDREGWRTAQDALSGADESHADVELDAKADWPAPSSHEVSEVTTAADHIGKASEEDEMQMEIDQRSWLAKLAPELGRFLSDRWVAAEADPGASAASLAISDSEEILEGMDSRLQCSTGEAEPLVEDAPPEPGGGKEVENVGVSEEAAQAGGDLEHSRQEEVSRESRNVLDSGKSDADDKRLEVKNGGYRRAGVRRQKSYKEKPSEQRYLPKRQAPA